MQTQTMLMISGGVVALILLVVLILFMLKKKTNTKSEPYIFQRGKLTRTDCTSLSSVRTNSWAYNECKSKYGEYLEEELEKKIIKKNLK